MVAFWNGDLLLVVSRDRHLKWRPIKGNVTKSPLGKASYDEDVELMFDVHKQWPQLGSIELYVTFEDGNLLYDVGQPSSSTTYHFQTQNTYSFQNYESYQPEPYFDQTETSELEPSQAETFQPEPYIPLGDMADFDQQEISEESEEETYFDEDEDEDEDEEDDNDNGGDLEPEPHVIKTTYDPPFHMCNLNLDYAYQSSEFDMSSNEPPLLDASLEIGMKYVIKCVNPQCLFKCMASLSQKSKQWVIGRLKGPHNCANSSMSQDHTKLDSNIICESIKSLLKADPSIKVKVIIAHIQE
uniref:Probable WRKY transcription factor 10 n=1 Tax=Cicer arietinum TaxID=3827 RepID=A0A1S3EIB2_CICAR|nr:probable WRKY transcription factor 10 [Cicer arietinum]